jgi:threonyl-tRNA synthetase
MTTIRLYKDFDHELNQEELEQLENEMRKFMKKQLDYDKELYLKKYEEKLKAIIISK